MLDGENGVKKMPEHNRADDFTIGALVAELKAHREEFARYREESSFWRKEREKREQEFIDFMGKMSTPLKIAWGGISVLAITMVGSLATWIVHWFSRHWNP
jgi:hypothetical protein